MLRYLPVSLAIVLAVVCFGAGFAHAQPSYPLFDDVEDTAASEAIWTATGNAAILETGTGTANSGTHVWEFGGSSNIAFSGSVDLSSAVNPYVSFWARRVSSSASVALDVSVDDGATWQQAFAVQPSTGWTNYQVALGQYQVPGVRLRFRHYNFGFLYLDDVLFDDAPAPQGVQLSAPANHAVTVGWGESTAGDFEAYHVVLATSTSNLGYGGGSWVHDSEQRIEFEVTDRTELQARRTDLYFFGRTYYARVYERDTQGLVNAGTATRQITTSFNVATAVAPFVEDFDDGDPGWAANGPWGITAADAGEPGHSAPNAMEDSPGGLYENNRHKRLVVRVDFSGVERPLLRFNHRYQFGGGDFGEVYWATPAQASQNELGQRLAQFTGGAEFAWTAEELDLGALNAQAPSGQRVGFLVFWVNTNGSDRFDGWHLDDVAVVENPYTASYPLFDDVEEPAASRARWIEGTSELVETGEGTANSGTHVWELKTLDALTLGGAVDLSSAVNPYVSFWARRVSSSASVALDVSVDDGATWQQAFAVQPSTGWTNYQVALGQYQVPGVRLRFRHYNFGFLYLDDVLFDDAPAPQGVQLSAPANHAVTVGWGESTAGDFEAYHVVLATSTSNLGYGGGSWVHDSEQRIEFEVTDRTELQARRTDLYFFGRTYYARVYERDTQGLVNAGTATRQITTSFNVATAVAPFVEDFDDGDPGWAANGPWGITAADAGEPGHSAPNAMEDSPGGLYENNRHKRLVVRVDFSGVERPLLRFNHRYQFGGGDFGEVYWATPAQASQNELGQRLAQFTGGAEFAWTAEELDLGALNAQAPSGQRVGFLVFWVNTNGSDRFDGWHLDDVAVVENPYTASYPLFDDVEEPAASRARWIEGTSELVETGEGTANSGTHVWELKTLDALTLGGAVDLSSAVNPYVSFWARRVSSSASVALDVSVDDGATWQQAFAVQPSTGWTNYQVALGQYQVPGVRLRFRHYNFGFLYLDDVLLSGDFPANAIAVSAGRVEFAPREVGGRDTVVVSIFNPGTETLTGSTSLSGTGFLAISGSGAFELAPSGQQFVRVAFAPETAGVFTGALAITHNAENLETPFEVVLRGITPGAFVCLDVPIAAEWNLVSVPLTSEDPSTSALFPGTSNHFGYGEGYESVTAFTPREGYWLKSPGGQIVELCGAPVADQTVDLAEGWNLVGGFDAVVATSELGGTAVIGSSFFGYDAGYDARTLLRPGEGYWVKADAAGTLVFGSSFTRLIAARSTTGEADESGRIRLHVTDADGRASTLYLAAQADARSVLPPAPPAGAFDLRFGSGLQVEAMEAGAHELQMRGAVYPVTVRAEGLDGRVLAVSDALGAGLLSDEVHEDAPLTLPADVGSLSIRLTAAVPDEYALSPLYPNPLRTRATIPVSLPEDGHVTISLYNVLGQRVAIVLDEMRAAGVHDVALEADGLAAGVYFVRMVAGDFQATQRFVVIR